MKSDENSQSDSGSGVQPEKKASVLKSAASMAMGTLASRILGMVREMALAALFPRMVSDAFVVAFKLPNLFRRVLGEGSIAAAFIPLYVEAKTRGTGEIVAGTAGGTSGEAVAFRNSIYSMLSVLTATLSVLGIIFMEPIMSLLVGGEAYMAVEGKFELTVLMARIMFSFLYLVTTYAFVMSVANSHGIFFLPAVAPAVFNAVFIIFAFLPQLHFQGDQLAWAVLVAGLMQLIVASYPLLVNDQMPRLTLRWRVPRVAAFFRNVFPSMIGMSVAQFLGLMNVYFASKLGEGTHTYIYFADRILEIPQALLSVSLGVALLPTLSEHWARGEKSEMLQVAQRHMRLLLVMTLPAAVGLYFLAEPIVKVIYERGQFRPEETSAVAQVLAIYTIAMIFTSVHRVTVPVFYAVKNTWLPAADAAFCLVLHFFLASYATEHYGIRGLVGATVLTGLVNLIILLVAHRILIGPLGLWRLLLSALHLLPALAVLAGICLYAMPFMRAFVGVYMALPLTIVGAAAFFFLTTWVTRHPEARDILNILLRRLRGRLYGAR